MVSAGATGAAFRLFNSFKIRLSTSRGGRYHETWFTRAPYSRYDSTRIGFRGRDTSYDQLSGKGYRCGRYAGTG